MNTNDKLYRLTKQFDDLNDQFYLAIQKTDGDEMDRIGRELVLLGKVIKEVGYEMTRAVRG